MTDSEWKHLVSLIDVTNDALGTAEGDDVLVLDFKTIFKKYESARDMCLNVVEDRIELKGITTDEDVIYRYASYKDATYYLGCFRLMRPLR